MPLVSVIIPTYKHRDYVLQTLASVSAQTFTDYEIIVVNDGSPDDTAEVLRPLAEAGRIRYIAQANAGQAAARNRGIAEATGDYIALLDDDDMWSPDKLERQVQLLTAYPQAVMAYGSIRVFSQDSEPISPGEAAPNGPALQAFLERNWIGSPGQTLIRGDVLRTIGGFDPTIWGADDWELYIRLAAEGPFIYDPHIALHYRLHDNNASRNVWKMYVNSCRVSRKHFALLPKGNRQVRRLTGSQHMRRYFYHCAMTLAQQQIQTRQWSKAGSALLTSIGIYPKSLFTRTVLKNLALCLVIGWGGRRREK